jgi:triosephosphate isomerase
MKKLLIAGNWKSNKTNAEARQWVEQIQQMGGQFPSAEQVEVICFAPFTTLSVLQWDFTSRKLPFSLGAQNISKFKEGSYTGEIHGHQIQELASWVLIGHSERRMNLGESEEDVEQKVLQAKEAGLKIIFCVSDSQTPIPAGVDSIAYEPIASIGTGTPDTPQNAQQVCSQLKGKFPSAKVLYGGSVTEENVSSFLNQPDIDGVLVGGASLDPKKFFQIIQKAAQLIV